MLDNAWHFSIFILNPYSMRFILSCLCILLFIHREGRAQAFEFTGEEKLTIDRCNAIIANPASHDTSLVSAYVNLAEVLNIADFDTMLPLCTKAQAIAEKRLHPKDHRK